MCHHLIGPTKKCDSLMCHSTNTSKTKIIIRKVNNPNNIEHLGAKLKF